MDEKYTYNGKEYSRADLEAKYGDKVDDAISKFGFELVQTSDKSDSDKEQVYSYGGVDYTQSQLNDKYGDKVNQAIEKFGIKKKDSTQPVQTQPAQTQPAQTQPAQTQPVQAQEAATQGGPLLGLGAVSEQATISPSVGVDESELLGKSSFDDLKESIQNPLLKSQERAKRQQAEPESSLNVLRTEKFVPYTEENLEDEEYKNWKSTLPENLQQETEEYDLYGAYKSGMQPIEVAPGEYHMSSRDPKTGRILKSEDHESFSESVIEDEKLGYITYKSNDGNIYSKKQYEIDIAGDAKEIFRVDDTGAIVKESVAGGKDPVSDVQRGADKRKLDLEIDTQSLLTLGDNLFDEEYMSSNNVIDKYAPKEITKKGATGGPGGLQVYEETVRDQEKEDRYNLALNEAKKSILQEKIYGLTEAGETFIDAAESDIDKSMNSFLESVKYADGAGREYRSTFDKLMTPKLVKKKSESIYEMLLPDHVAGAEMMLDESIHEWVESNSEDMGISDEAKKMAKVRIKDEYKERKRLEEAANSVAKETGLDIDEVISDGKKIVQEIDSYEKQLKSLYIPYEVKAKKAQQRMTLEFEQVQDIAVDRISNSQEYKDLISEYQTKVNSGEMTAEEANSAVSQKANIMLSGSPEAVELQRKYKGVLSSYDSELKKKTEAIYGDIESSLNELKGLSTKDEDYRKKLLAKIKEMHKAEQSEIESDYKKLSFGGLSATDSDTKLSRAMYSGLGDIASGLAGGIESKFGETELTRKLTSINNQLKSDNPMIDIGEFGFKEFSEDPFNEDWWATRVAPSAPMTFSLMVPGLGVGAGSAALATRIGLTGLSRALVAGTVSGVGMRASESFTEAGLHYYDMIERGESVKYASKGAAKTYSENMNLLGLDVLEMTTFFLPAASRAVTLGKFIAQVPLNMAEELIQEGLPAQELAYNRYLKGDLTPKEIADGVSEYDKVFSGGTFSDMYNFLQTPQGQEVALIGGIYGGAFGGVSLPGDIKRVNSQRKLNSFLNEEIVKYSSTEITKTSGSYRINPETNELELVPESKPLEFGRGGVVRGPAETMQEAKNRRIWQLKSTLDEMQMKGLINEDDTKLGKKQIDFAFGVADQMPVNLPLVTRGQLLQKLTEIEDLEQGLEGMTNETLIGNQKKKIAKLKKESEEIIGGNAKGYFINNVSVTLEEFSKIASNPEFADRVINGEVDVVIMNDTDTQKSFANVVEGYKTGKEELKVLDKNERIEKALAILEPIASAREELTADQLTEVSEILGEELAGELISDQISKAPDAVELYNLLDDNKVKIDDTQVTEQEGVGTEEQVGEERAGQVQEPEVSQEEGATDSVLQEQVEDATEEIVEGIKSKVNQSKDDAKTKRRKRKALGAVSNILNFKSNILPDTKVKVHETDESYRSATGVDGPGVYDATNDTIHINLAHEEAGDETVYHEMIHPIIYSAVKNETEARILTQRMVEGIVRSSGGNKEIVDKLKGWLEQYESAERPEETIAEVASIIASEFKNLGVSAKNIIKDYINRMARKFGGKNLFRAVSKDADVVKVLNRLSEAMQAGEAITAEDLRSGEFEIKTGVERDVEQGTLVEGAEGTIPEGIDDSKGSPIDLKLKMPKNLLDRGGINIDDIKRGSINDLSGSNAFVFAADQATYGLVKSPTGIEHRFFGGYLFPYGNKFGWAFTGEEGANKIISKINESDGIGLVMSQAPDGIKGSLAFWEYMYAEIENAISKGVSEQKILEYVNSKLQLAKIPQTLKEKGIKTQIDRLDELKTLMPIEGKNKISYEVRGSFTKAFFSATSFDEFGIPPLNKTAKVDLGVLDYVNDPSLKSVGYGDIVSAIQFDKDAKPIRLDKNDPNYHPSYPVVISGKPIMVFNNAVDVRDVYPNAVPKSEKASQVPLGQRKKSAAARSAMGGQYIAEVPSGISEGQPIIKQRKASPEKFVSELEKTKASDPTQYWSVDSVKLSAAKKGKVISVDGGYGFVSNDGDIKGVFKLPTSKVKGVADKVLQESVKQGGTKLDNFDGYLTKIYERNGFRIAARIPFNEEFSPDGWNKAKHGTPDVVAMVYDPNNKLGIKEKKFDDYDAGIAYRDSFLEDKAPADKKPGVKQRKPSAPDQKVRASIDFQNRYGKYFTISRDFNNKNHLENYIDFMERKGNKEIGTNTFPIGLKQRKSKPTGNIDWQKTPEGKGDPAITVRNEAVQQAAEQLKDGKITKEEYRQTVIDNSPIAPIKTFFKAVFEGHARRALGKKADKLFSELVDDTGKKLKRVALRLDIPSYKNLNAWIVSIHNAEGKTKDDPDGKVVSYMPAARIKNVSFSTKPFTALRIASGIKDKSTFARMIGDQVEIPGETFEEVGRNAEKMVDEIWKSDEWVQIGMNPFRHSYFYDRSKNIGSPVVSAEEVIQVGGLVYAKNVKYESPDSEVFATVFKGETLKDKEGKTLKFRKPKVKSPLETSIDKNVKGGIEKETKSWKTDLKNARRNFIDFRGDIKDLTKTQKELEGVYERIITSLGSNGVAKLSFDKAYEQIYDGLGPKQRDALDKVIIARRIIAVNENRAVNNVDAIEDLFNNVPEFFNKKGGDYVTSFQQTMVDISNTVSNTPLEKDTIIDEALTLMSLMPVMYSGIEKAAQDKILKELKKELESKLKSENVTFSDEEGNPHGLNAAYELLDAKRDELGDELYDKINKRADKYFDKFQEMLDQDLADGIVSQDQYNAMKGIDYSPRVFVQFIYGIDNEIINNTSEADNVNGVLSSTFGLNKDAIRTLRDGVRNDDLNGVFFKMITNSEVLLGNYINSRERLRKMNDLNSYTLGQLVDLEQKFNDLKSKSKLTKEERIEFETLKETFDAFSIKRKKGYLPVNFYEEGVKKKFYIRGDLYSQWYNLRPDLSIKLNAVDKVLHSPIGILKTFATGVLSPLFGITASAIDLTQLMVFSDAKGFGFGPGKMKSLTGEMMLVKASQIAKDLVGVPFFQKGVIRSILQEDELFVEAVNEGIMMDFLYTQGNMNVVKSMLKTGIETALEKTELGFGGYVKSKKALLKLAEATLILNKMAELAPRLVAYQRTRDFEYAKIDKMVKEDALSKQEEDQMRKNARVKAAAIARELMNFAEGGEVTKGFVDRYSTYFNPAMQGTVTAARQTKENPIRTTSRAAQTAAMFSGMVLGLVVMLPAMLKDDDDDKEINEIIKETRDNASPYIKEKYFLIPTGKKDEDGNYTSIRLKKHPQMVPFYELFEIGYDNYLNGDDATAVVSKENALRILHVFFDNALPVNVFPVDKEGNWRGKTILAEPFQRNPMLGGGLELITGYDIYRNKMIEPQTFNNKNADQAVKGLLNPYTEDFYKSFALEMQDATGASLSPAEYKHFVERMITNPRNNLYVAAGYALLNQASDLDISKKDKSFFEDASSMVSKKLIYSSTSKKGISKTKDSEFIDDYRAIDNKTYLIRESARKIAQEVTKEGGLMKIASKEEKKKMLEEGFNKFEKTLKVVAETYPEMNMDPEVTANEYASYLANKIVLEAMPVDELNMRKYQEILSEPYGQYKYQKQALLFAHEFTKNGVMINPTSEDFILILDQMDKISKNSNKNFMANEFSIEYMYLYAQKTGTITTESELNKAMKKYRMK